MTGPAAGVLAASAWVGGLVGILAGRSVAAPVPAAAVSVCGAVVLLALAGMLRLAARRGRRGRRAGPAAGPRRRDRVLLAAAAAATLLVSGVGAGLRAHGVVAGPLAHAVAQAGAHPRDGVPDGDAAGGGAAAEGSVAGGAAAVAAGGARPAGGGSVGVEVAGTLVTDPRVGRHGGWSAVLRLSAVRHGPHGARRSRERVLLRVREGGPDLPGIGSRLQVRGLAAPPAAASVGWLRTLGVAVEVRSVALEVTGAPHRLLLATTTLRAALSRAAHERLPPGQASLLTGLVTGDVAGQPEDLAEDVDRAGLSHLVAVSGSNVALVVGGVMAVVLLLGVGRRAAWWASLAAVWWLVVLVRAEPSVVRAALMGTLVLLAHLLGRPRHALHLLAVGVLLALLADPMLAARIGFGLSVSATVGVLTVSPLIRPWLPLPGPLATVVAATVGAQVCVAPLLLAIGGTVGPASVPANVVAVPAAAVASVLGTVAALASLVAPGAAAWLAGLARPPLDVVVWSATTFAGPAGRTLDRWTVPILLTVGLLVAAHLLARRRTNRSAGAPGVVTDAPRDGLGSRGVGAGGASPGAGRRPSAAVRAAVVPVGAAVVAAVAVVVPPATGLPSEVRMVVLDVGQGDAILLGDPVAGWMLVDGGPDVGVLRRALDRHGVAHLRAVVVSHPHADHDAGLVGIVGALGVDTVVVGPQTPDARPSVVVAEATAAGVPVVQVSAGASWSLGRIGVRVLSPPPRGIDADANESSLVLRIDVAGGRSALLTGDAERIAQGRLLRTVDAIDVDVLKVPHHGGATNADGFLAATTPQVAVVSAGEGNPFGHPHPDVLADLIGVDVRRTDRDGDVVVPLGRGP